MKHLLLALLFVTFLGWHTVLTSDCNVEKTEPCIRNSINCREAEQCYANAEECRNDDCFSTATGCEHTTMVIKKCFHANQCSEPYNFAKLIKEKCINPPSAGVAALTGFTAMTVCFLTYFFIV